MHLNVESYCDVDWASCLDDRRSTIGLCILDEGNLISLRSKKQPVVSLSTAEVEYRAMSVCLSEMLCVDIKSNFKARSYENWTRRVQVWPKEPNDHHQLWG